MRGHATLSRVAGRVPDGFAGLAANRRHAGTVVNTGMAGTALGGSMNMLAGRYIGGLTITAHDRQFRAARPMKASTKVIPATWDNRQILTAVQDQGSDP